MKLGYRWTRSDLKLKNLKTLRATVTSVETSLTEAWAKIDDFKEDLKTQKSIKEAQ